jgi:Sulfatase-modifying factor enzyme 1/Putative metal-binding motif
MRTNQILTKALMVAAALALAACQQDPYKLRTIDDAGPTSDAWLDLFVFDQSTHDATDISVGDTGNRDQAGDICLNAEFCNGKDDDCDGKIDEDFDLQTDPLNCGKCGTSCMWLSNMNAYPGCVAGKCAIKACFGGYIDKDKDPKNGCEYACIPTGVEICDGLDNDCNGLKDDGVSLAQNICKTIGPCKGAKAQCKGTAGWQCVYSADVELLPCTKDADCGGGYTCDTTKGVCPGITVIEEKKCDGKDGDCDGVADDAWASLALSTALGTWCDLAATPKKGVCRSIGVYACNAAGTGVSCQKKPCTSTTICRGKDKNNIPNPNQATTCVSSLCAAKASSAEKCNGLDDDCDGTVDDAVTDELWTNVGSGSSAFKIFRYEASRPDATSTKTGILTTGRPCSVAGRLPWSSITKTAAQAACKKAGGRLCSTAEWEQACKGSANTTFPYGNTFIPTRCNGRAYDTNTSVAGNQDTAIVTSKPTLCVSKWNSVNIWNMSGNVKEWTATSFNSSGNPTNYEIKGGAYDTPSISIYGAGLSCTYDLPAPSTTLQLPTLGFRCCKK